MSPQLDVLAYVVPNTAEKALIGIGIVGGGLDLHGIQDRFVQLTGIDVSFLKIVAYEVSIFIEHCLEVAVLAVRQDVLPMGIV